MFQTIAAMTMYAEAQAIANAFRCRVGIYPTGSDDGRFRHWDWRAETAAGTLPAGHVDILFPVTNAT